MDSPQGKLFLGRISWETSEEILKDHFIKYGIVLECVIMRDKYTGTARGFGFVLFSDPSAADKALQDKHVILGRTLEVKKAVPRCKQHQNQQHPHPNPHQQQNKGLSKNSSNGDGSNNQFRTKKIFVGGLSANLTEDEFKSYFEKFGSVTDVVVMYDNATHRPRGFGFITFDSEEAVENALQKSFHELNDKLVEVKKAVPKDGNNYGYNNYNSYNMRLGGRRGSPFGGFQFGICPPYSPRFGIYPGYVPSPYSGYGSVGGYPIGGYGGVAYGADPRSPWNGPGMIGARWSPVPYGNAAMYPSYMNVGVGGVMGMATGGYCGIMGPTTSGKWNQGGGDVRMQVSITSPQANVGKLEDDSSGFTGSYGAAGKQNQRASDGRFRLYSVSNSS